MKIIPSVFLLNAHHWMILHGRYVCQARKPKCQECLLRDLCDYKNQRFPAKPEPAVNKAS
jgi:endonuclease-3